MHPTTWFRWSGSKVHLLAEDSDKDRFPLGRAHCAPFDRRTQDTLHSTNEVNAEDFCMICVVGVGKLKNK